MEEKLNAVYVMVRLDELTPEDGGDYDGPLQRQTDTCLRFIQEMLPEAEGETIEVYRSRAQLLKDVERHRVKRLIVLDTDRLGSGPEEVDAVLFELKMENIEVVSVQ